MRKTLIFILLLTAVAAGQMPVPALPRMYIDTTWNPPSGGVTWHARISADLQNALNSAHPGDTIVLDAGSIYTGNFTLPAKANPLGSLWCKQLIFGTASGVLGFVGSPRISRRTLRFDFCRANSELPVARAGNKPAREAGHRGFSTPAACQHP